MTTERPRPRRGDVFEVVVERLAYGGSGVARLAGGDREPGMAVFVPRSAPGDRLRIRLEKVRRRHAEASVVEVLEAGPDRVTPPCPHYDEGCGGCSWQHLDPAAQEAAKVEVVRDSLARIGGFEDVPLRPLIRAEEPWYYRNKMEFSFHARDGLGLHVAGDWRRVVPISECRLESELAMRIVAKARAFHAEHSLTAWDPIEQTGLLREIVVRHGRGTNETMVGVITSAGPFEKAPALASELAQLDESIVSVVRGVRGDGSSGSDIESIQTLHGRDSIFENVAGLSFAIGLQTFFQTNTAQAARMLEVVRQRAAEVLDAASAQSRVLDVFCGVGFFTLGLAALAREAIGIEIVEPSIVAARANAERNGITNTSFYAGDARRTLPDVIARHGAPALVVLDPPRSGAGGKVMRRIARSQAPRIVYVSCNPTTLARDLKELEPFGYRIIDVCPIDLFPQTYHIETIVTLDL